MLTFSSDDERAAAGEFLSFSDEIDQSGNPEERVRAKKV